MIKFRFLVQASLLLLVLGLFVMACGKDSSNPFYSCSSGYSLCGSTGKCCQTNYWYCTEGAAQGQCCSRQDWVGCANTCTKDTSCTG